MQINFENFFKVFDFRLENIKLKFKQYFPPSDLSIKRHLYIVVVVQRFFSMTFVNKKINWCWYLDLKWKTKFSKVKWCAPELKASSYIISFIYQVSLHKNTLLEQNIQPKFSLYYFLNYIKQSRNLNEATLILIT